MINFKKCLIFSNSFLINYGYRSKGTNGQALIITFANSYIQNYSISIQRIQEGTYCKEGNPCVTIKNLGNFSFIVRAAEGAKNEASYNYSWLTVGF